MKTKLSSIFSPGESSRARIAVLAFIALLALLALVTAVNLLSMGGDRQPGSRGQAQLSHYAVFTGTEDIPYYAGASLLGSFVHEDNRGFGGYAAIVNAPVEDVRAFYTSVLQANGWQVASESGDSRRYMLNFLKYTEGQVFTRRTLSLTVSRSRDGSLANIDYGFWPDPNAAPRTPDAEDVDVGWKRGSRDDPVKVITFTSHMSPSEIDAYYRKIMPQYGWSLAWLTPPSGVAFNFGDLDPYGGEADVWSYVSVVAHSTGSNTTSVTMEIMASDLSY